MSSEEEKLLKLFGRMDQERRRMLLEFAEFLHERSEPVVQEIAEPEDIPRPHDETVVAAIRRLSRTYPMLDKREVLNQASALMAKHVMEGKDAAEVIDELELVFERSYRALCESGGES